MVIERRASMFAQVPPELQPAFALCFEGEGEGGAGGGEFDHCEVDAGGELLAPDGGGLAAVEADGA